MINNSLGPLPYTMLSGQPTLTVLHTPPTLEKVNAVISRPGWRPDPHHVYVSVSEFNSASWRSMLPVVHCIPNGIFLDRWRDKGTAEPGLAVWSARIAPEKGLHLAIDAARQSGLRLEITGPIANQTYFDTEIIPRLGDEVIYLGHLGHDQLAVQLSRGSVFVSSSMWPEPFGLSLVEAMSCGTPVAAFAVGAAAEIVKAGAGALATDQTAEALALAIDTARRCDRRRVRAEAESFDALTMIDRYESLMDSMINTRYAFSSHS